MTLTMGTGPFARQANGQWNFEYDGPAHALYLHEHPRRLRAVVGGETVLDTTAPRLLHETGLLPRYYVPREDVNWDLFEPTDHSTYCPFKGDARYWTLRAGDAVLENVVWEYPEPIEGAPDLAGLVSFYWEPIDHWYEEDEEVFGHPRDPFHRVDVLAASRRVRVSVDGEVLADTTGAFALYETGLPVRWYIPRDDVRLDRMERFALSTRCAYKGQTSEYWTLDGERPLAWSYADPVDEVGRVAGLIAFFNERVDIEVDGESGERPTSPFSAEDWHAKATR